MGAVELTQEETSLDLLCTIQHHNISNRATLKKKEFSRKSNLKEISSRWVHGEVHDTKIKT